MQPTTPKNTVYLCNSWTETPAHMSSKNASLAPKQTKGWFHGRHPQEAARGVARVHALGCFIGGLYIVYSAAAGRSHCDGLSDHYPSGPSPAYILTFWLKSSRYLCPAVKESSWAGKFHISNCFKDKTRCKTLTLPRPGTILRKRRLLKAGEINHFGNEPASGNHLTSAEADSRLDSKDFIAHRGCAPCQNHCPPQSGSFSRILPHPFNHWAIVEPLLYMGH